MTTLAHGPGAPDEGFRAAWVAALEALELDVHRAEGLLRAGELDARPAPWQPPQIAAPLPADLRSRAQALLDRQLRTSAALTAALHQAGRQLAVAERFGAAGAGAAAGRPVYVDRAC